jgi:hypothetical protein
MERDIPIADLHGRSFADTDPYEPDYTPIGAITARHHAGLGPTGGSSENSQWAPSASLASDLGL